MALKSNIGKKVHGKQISSLVDITYRIYAELRYVKYMYY